MVAGDGAGPCSPGFKPYCTRMKMSQAVNAFAIFVKQVT
jgi:hypothetical protein